MKPWTKVFIIYPVLIGAASGVVGLILRNCLHSYVASFLLSFTLIHLVWLRFSVVPFVRRKREPREEAR